jgi:hypothetical protein
MPFTAASKVACASFESSSAASWFRSTLSSSGITASLSRMPRAGARRAPLGRR